MTSRCALIATLAGSLFHPLTGTAQTKEPPKPENARFGNPTSTARHLQKFLYGVVKKVGAQELVLDKTKYGVDQPVKLDARTKFVRDGKPSSLDELKAGDPVYVDVKTDKKTGTMTAKEVVSGLINTKSP